MALRRIKFSSSSDGSNPYTLAFNPSELALEDSQLMASVDILDGETAFQKAQFDSRERVLTWRAYPKTSNIGTVFQSMMATLHGFLGTIKYVHWGDADYRLHTTIATWHKFRVREVTDVIRPGGRVRYEQVNLILIPVPT